MADRNLPYIAFNFIVEFADGDIGAGFSEVSGLGMEITVAEYRNGNDKLNAVNKVAGMYKTTDVELTRGVMDSERLFDWLKELRTNGSENGAKHTVVVRLMDDANQKPVQSWKLIDAFPTKYTGPSLSAKGGGDVAVEKLSLTAVDIQFEQNAFPLRSRRGQITPSFLDFLDNPGRLFHQRLPGLIFGRSRGRFCRRLYRRFYRRLRWWLRRWFRSYLGRRSNGRREWRSRGPVSPQGHQLTRFAF